MADPNVPNQESNQSQAEGERWQSEPDTVENADRNENPEQLYDNEDSDDAGGISNRPLSEEVANQASLPSQGTERHDEERQGGD